MKPSSKRPGSKSTSSMFKQVTSVLRRQAEHEHEHEHRMFSVAKRQERCFDYLRGLMMPLTSWRMGMVRFLLGSMRSALAASCTKHNQNKSMISSTHTLRHKRVGAMITSSVLVMELRTVGRPLLPTRTSASATRCSNRTSIVGISIPTLRNQTRTNHQTPGRHGDELRPGNGNE